MAALLSPSPKFNALTNAGVLGAGYKLYTYLTGTSTPATTYSNRAGTVANTNPIILDARGEAVIFLTPGTIYRYVLKTDADVTVWTQDDISAQAGDAGAILFTQSGAGAVERSVQDKLRDTVNVKDFGAVGDGTTDASAAISAAIDEAIARGRCAIQFPAGRFLLNTKVAKTLTGQGGLSIQGAGMGITQIIVADSAGGLEFTAATGDGNWWLNVDPSSAIRIADLSILATANNLGTGLKINGNSLEGRPGAPVVLDHVEIRAKDSINGQAFLVGLHLHDCMSVLASHCRFLVGGTSNLTPTAVKIEATDATTDPAQTYFDNCEWFYGGKGIVASDYFEGLYLTNCTMAKCDVGVEWTATVGGGESGLHVVGGHWNCLTRNFDLNGVFDFAITGVVSFLSGGSPQAHIRTRNGGNFTITGNVFQAGTTGIDVGTVSGSARGGYIGSNQFSNQTTGIVLAADANNVRVGDNNYTNVTTRISGAGGTGATIAKRSYSVTTVVTLAGGAAYEDVNVAIPSGVFSAKPSVIVASGESSSQRIICFPVQTSASTTATNMVITVGKNDGTNLAAGAVRIHVVAFE